MAGYSVTYSVVDNATRQIDAINKRITAMRAPMERMSRSVSRFVDVSGLRKVAQGFEWIGKTAATVFRTLSQIVPVMGAITGAASIAGMVKLVNSYADWSHQLVQNADDIGTTTQQLQQFQDATRLAGGNAGDMTSSLKALHTNLADFAIGRGNFAEVGQMANYLGVNLRDANGQIRSAADLMPELIAKIAALPDPANRARAATELLGAEGGRLVETFRQSHQSFAQCVYRCRPLYRVDRRPEAQPARVHRSAGPRWRRVRSPRPANLGSARARLRPAAESAFRVRGEAHARDCRGCRSYLAGVHDVVAGRRLVEGRSRHQLDDRGPEVGDQQPRHGQRSRRKGSLFYSPPDGQSASSPRSRKSPARLE